MEHPTGIDTPLTEEQEHAVRDIAREEIASLAALVLRRTQEAELTRDPQRNMAHDATNDTLAAIFGEALTDFGGRTGSGAAPGQDG